MALSTNAEINSSQIAALLAVVNTVGMALSNLEDSFDSSERAGDDPRVPLDSTMLNACARLDTILSDDSRWELPELDGHISQQGVAHQQERALALVNNQKNIELAVAELNRRRALFLASLQPTPPTPKKRHVKRKKQ